ncbi:hypothetical protein ACFS2C_07030 [Prauserella oleivorans]|uniref:Uncharacterized protein n=1 Tax=Prauserella oleivorans TaxID=1478153 RepID=A0ABW5W5C0_9PSEU
MSDMPYQPTGTQSAPPAPAKRRHIFRWFFLAIQAAFLAWIIAGIAQNSDSCVGEVGAALEACQAGTAVGTGIGVGLIIGLWAAVDIILGITWLVFRKR